MIKNQIQRKLTFESNDNQSKQMAIDQGQKRNYSGNVIPLLPNKKELTLCFQQKQLYGLGYQLPYYLNLIKFIIFALILSIAVYALPLSILLFNSNSISSTSLLIKLSIFNDFSTTNLDLLTYFSISLYCIHFIIIILLSIKLRTIKKHIAEKGIFPSDYAVFVKLAAAHLKEEDICNRIQSWFGRQIKKDKSFLQLFPQFPKEKEQNQEEYNQSLFSNQPQKAKKINSTIIQSILLSFSYEDYLKLMLEVNYLETCISEQNTNLKPQEITALIEVYNKKKNILNVLPTNQYCLVIFKNIQYAKYFYQNNQGNVLTSFFYPQTYYNLQIQRESIQVFDQLFPNQIKWEELHYDDCYKIKRRFATVIVFTLFILIGLGCQFASIYLSQYNLIPHSSIFALIINFLIIISNRILRTCIRNQAQPYYSSTQKAFILYATSLNIILLTIAPLVISYLINPQIIYKAQGGYLSYQMYSILFYTIFNIANIYICSASTNQKYYSQISEKERTKQLKTINEHKIEYLLTVYLTTLSIAYFLAPFFPLILAIVLSWFVFIFGLQRYNLIKFYDHLQYHGQKLIHQMAKYLQRSVLCCLFGLIFIYSFASSKFNYSWPISAYVVIPLLIVISVLFELLDVDRITVFCSKENQTQLLAQRNYSKVQQNFVILYESFNFALSYNLMQNDRPNGYSTRIKMYQQLNTMSKTLSLSLKQKLFKNGNPMPGFERKLTQHDEQKEVYFQYQKKIHMQKSKPKISIPPLFKKEESIHLQNSKEEEDVQMKNFNSIFSSDDREGRRIVKQHIINKLNQKAVQK